VVLVPSAAINRGAQGTVVYVVRDDSTVTLRPVTTGATEGQDTQIESGLRAGERVVTDGVDRIREGVKVEVTQPATRGGGGQGMDPAKREEMRKKMEGMTPEQKQEFIKKMREQRAATGAQGGAPAPAPAQAATPAPEAAKVEPGKAPPAAGTPRPTTPVPPPDADTQAKRDEFRKSLEGMSPEERKEAVRKRLESLTPEQREAYRKRRAAEGREGSPQ